MGPCAEIFGILFMLAGIVTNAAMISDCQMFKLGFDAGCIGPWRAGIEGSGCTSWSQHDVEFANDWRVHLAAACSCLALLFGCIVALYVFFSRCIFCLPLGSKSPCALNAIGVAVQICLLMTWPLIGSTACQVFGCKWGRGATLLAFSHIFYFVGSLLIYFIGAPKLLRHNQTDITGNKPDGTEGTNSVDAAELGYSTSGNDRSRSHDVPITLGRSPQTVSNSPCGGCQSRDEGDVPRQGCHAAPHGPCQS